MVDTALCLEALSALSGCSVQQSSGSSPLGPQDFVNIVALRQFYRREGLQELEYPSLGSLSLRDDAVNRDMDDLYSAPPALLAPPTPESRPVAHINPDDFFDRKFDYDFTNVKDGDRRFMRGNEPYLRPCGWGRVALNVSGKYDEGSDVWLGTGSQAWPVSYQGLHMDGSLILIRRHGSQKDGGHLDEAAQSLMDNSDFGRGIYSTPDVLLAEKYCKTFKSNSNGKTYKVLLQNRISPTKRKVCERDRVWVVYVPQDYNQVQTMALVQESVRPYGLLLKEA